MDGLNCREITLKEALANKDKRIDSQFWTTCISKNTRYTYSKIGNILLSSQYGMSVDLNTEGIGYPIFRMNEMHNMLTDLEVEKYANVSNIEYQIFSLNNKDVLFNRTNSYEWVGRTGIYYKNDNTPFTYASYLVRFVPDNSVILPEYLTAFLNTSIGVKAIKARARQSVNQTNVNPEEVKEIEIPLLTMEFQKIIEGMFLTANKQRVVARSLYNEVLRQLEQCINISVDIARNAYTEKMLSDSFNVSGRLDAEYYQPKYEQIETAIKNTKHTYLDVICDVDSGEFISETLYGQEGFSYIRGTDITSHCIDVENATKVNTTINGLNVIENGDLAFAMIGSVGNVSINRGTTAIVSNNLGTIKPHDKKLSNYLLVYLLSDIGQALFEKYQTRTAQPKIKKEDVGKFLVPLLSDDEIEFISNKAEESFRLKEKSKELLDIAIKAVEMAIETDEDSALLWLEIQKL